MERTCLRKSGKPKRSYATLEEAEVEAARTDPHDPLACHAYLCSCGSYHVGNVLSRRLRAAVFKARKPPPKKPKRKA